MRDVRKIDLRRLWDPRPETICCETDIVSDAEPGQDAVRDRTMVGGVRALSSERETEAERLPAPSAELVLIRVMVSAYLATAPRRRAEAFLRHAATLLENEESVSLLLPIRPPTQHSALSKARRQAVAMFRELLPALVASMAAD